MATLRAFVYILNGLALIWAILMILVGKSEGVEWSITSGIALLVVPPVNIGALRLEATNRLHPAFRALAYFINVSTVVTCILTVLFLASSDFATVLSYIVLVFAAINIVAIALHSVERSRNRSHKVSPLP